MLDGVKAYRDADFVIIAVSTNGVKRQSQCGHGLNLLFRLYKNSVFLRKEKYMIEY